MLPHFVVMYIFAVPEAIALFATTTSDCKFDSTGIGQVLREKGKLFSVSLDSITHPTFNIQRKMDSTDAFPHLEKCTRCT